jgi:hypothetical protein
MAMILNCYITYKKNKEVIMETAFTNKKSRFIFTHPLKEEFRKRKIPLWCLRNCTDVSEPKLSRYLNNIDRMPRDLESRLYRLLDMLNGDFSFVDETLMESHEPVNIEADIMLKEDNKE